jgi:hypothetical protein
MERVNELTAKYNGLECEGNSVVRTILDQRKISYKTKKSKVTFDKRYPKVAHQLLYQLVSFVRQAEQSSQSGPPFETDRDFPGIILTCFQRL